MNKLGRHSGTLFSQHLNLCNDSGGLGCSLLGLRQERMKAPATVTATLLIRDINPSLSS